MSVFKTVGIAVLLAGAAAVSGCKSLDKSPNVGPCPVAATISDVERIAEIHGADTYANVGFTGQIDGVKGYCRYVGDDPIDMNIDVDFSLGRGPKAEGDHKEYRYFVAVMRRDSVVLAKKYFTLDAKFGKGQTVVRRRENVGGIIIPRAAETISGTNFEIIVGFDLTPEELEFNRAGKRFRMQTQ